MRSEFCRAPNNALTLLLLLCLLCAGATRSTQAQTISAYEKQRGQMMLDQVKNDIKKNYYDTAFHGVDLEARFKEASEKIKTAQSVGQMLGIIAQAVLDLNDSHTFFIPPGRQALTDYGWYMNAIGDRCFVTEVKPGSDAEKKGIKVGDEVLLVDGYAPTRENLWKLNYLYYVLRPQTGMRVGVRSPDGKERELDILAKVVDKRRLDLTSYTDFMQLVRESENAERDRLRSHRTHEAGPELIIWKMPGFNLEPNEVDGLMNKVAGYKTLILDLRGNRGGYELTLQRLLGNVFDRDVTIGEIQRRKETKPLVAKTRGDKVFQGKLIVLVDSNSASSAEIFARMIQLHKRGTVIGDLTAGAVMRARQYQHEVGIDTVAFYGMSVTDADLRMTDGKSLERVGVTPDELKLPTGADLAAKRDPVLAYAASLAGVEIDPAKAGALFPELKK